MDRDEYVGGFELEVRDVMGQVLDLSVRVS
jgi:hypothetical protein